LEEALRDGACRMLRVALEAEVAVYVEAHEMELDPDGRRRVVRNGRMPRRTLQTGLGPVEIEQPRVHDRRDGERFNSAILPRYLRRSPSVEALIPWLYLKGVSTNDFPAALQSLPGEGAAGLSPSTITRLKAAWEAVFPETRQQRCWVHKTRNVLDKMPKKVHPSAKDLLHEMYLAATKADALAALDEFVERYGAKYPKAVACLVKDKDVLFTFYDFPAEHWQHIGGTNVIEATFATVRHRHRQTKGCGSRVATLAMVFKLAREAEKRWRRIDGYALIVKLLAGVRFEDGVEAEAA
jgi:transposase-like protein